MSTRDSIIAVTSIEALRAVVGSNDQELYDALLRATEEQLEEDYGPRDELEDDVLEEYDEQLAETTAELKRMILTAERSAAEPGSWVFLIQQILRTKQLKADVRLEFNKGYKHWYAWQPYREAVASRLRGSAIEALLHLENGRPLQGKSLVPDGCLFAWLTRSEIAGLHESLSKITAAEVGNPDLEEFHQDLVDALATLKKTGCDLVLSAH